jgi:Cof subfamily protein (haloacid dehalogenase superfamily)
MTRPYSALVLDIDGTLLDEQEQLHERTASAIARARAAGTVVMLATGRSHHGTREIAQRLDLDTPAIVFNGAAVYGLREDRLLSQYWLADAFVSELLDYAQSTELLQVVARADAQAVRTPLAHEATLLGGFRNLHAVPFTQLPRTEALRVTLFSQRHADSATLLDEVQRAVPGHPAYYTHFGLCALAGFRDSSAQVVDVQPYCQGKAEALPLLQRNYGIAPEQVVAVGDASNDIPILRAAGLGVAMGHANPETKAVAKRVIGDNHGTALAELIEELFL